MIRRTLAFLSMLVFGLALMGSEAGAESLLSKLKGKKSGPTSAEISDGLKEALKVGSDRVIARLGAANGFNADPVVHIPLPKTLEKIRKPLAMVGRSGMLDDLELRLNRAAEMATARTGEMFWTAIKDMTWEDALKIYKGPDDAATQYFRGKMSEPLSATMRPIVDKTLNEAGAVKSYDKMMSKYQTLPFVPDVKADLSTHVVNLALDGVFHYLAEEEAAIRRDPVKRTTKLLAKVFGAK